MVFLRFVALVAFALVCSVAHGQTVKPCGTCDPAKCPVVREDERSPQLDLFAFFLLVVRRLRTRNV